MKSFVINLAKRKDRIEHVYNNYTSKLLDIEIFNAFDGKNLDNNPKEYIELKNEFIHNIKNNNTKNIHYPFFSFNPFTLGELGCFMSHLILWKKIITENIDKLIILEDDCIINETFDVVLKDVLENELPTDFNIIFLGGRPEKFYRCDKDVQISKNISIKYDNNPYGTYSYIISRKGAELLYNYAMNVFKGKLGVDYFIDDFFKKNNELIHVISSTITYSLANNNGENNIFKTDVR
jgi:glycosyl transferase family 25